MASARLFPEPASYMCAAGFEMLKRGLVRGHAARAWVSGPGRLQVRLIRRGARDMKTGRVLRLVLGLHWMSGVAPPEAVRLG